MPYSNSKKSIRRVESFLKMMVDKNEQFEISTEDSKKLAYNIFQGIKTSVQFMDEEPYKSYASLNSKFIIRDKGNKVLFEPRDISLSIKTKLFELEFPNLTTVLQIIGALIQNKASSMFFPDAELSGEEIERLRNWAKLNKYTVQKEVIGLRLKRI